MQLLSASPKKIGGKVTYQTPLPDPTKKWNLCALGYKLFNAEKEQSMKISNSGYTVPAQVQ